MARGAPLAAVWERWTYIVGTTPPLPPFVEIRAGSFRMGSEKDADWKPVHPVTFSQPFFLGATEVSFHEWDACLADGGCNYRPADQGWGREMRPVINVSWEDAQTYVAWLSQRTGKTCRLPSEAQWEYAARAGTTTEYALPAPDGSDDIYGKALAQCRDCGVDRAEQTAPVGQFPANAWRLYDMHGNVFEWVEDCWHDGYENAPNDGSPWREEENERWRLAQPADGADRVLDKLVLGDCSRGVLRGGSWDQRQDFARSAFRGWRARNFRYYGIGFRVVCSSPISGTDR